MGSREPNKYGLTRYVPAPVEREIRQRCGFGCVVCGLGIYDYEHFDPEFPEARAHVAAGMTLLCPRCNQKRARGSLSVETVAAANASPKCLQQGFASETFDFHAEPITVQVAGVTFFDCRHIIVVNGVPILSVAPPEAVGQPIRLSGFFADRSGKVGLRIRDNVWQVSTDPWDVEQEGPRITIRSGRGDINLVVRTDPPTRLVIERIDMRFKGVRLRGNAEVLEVFMNGVRWTTFKASGASHCVVGMRIENGHVAANEGYFSGL